MKKFNIILVCILICFLNINANSQGKIQDFNGEDWVDTSESLKIGMVYGFTLASYSIERDVTNMLKVFQEIAQRTDSFELTDITRIKISIEPYLKKYTIYKTQMGTIIEVIDEFYENTRNRRILITGAFEYVSMSLQGATDEELKEKVEYLRIFEIPNPDEKKIRDYWDRELPKILKEK